MFCEWNTAFPFECVIVTLQSMLNCKYGRADFNCMESGYVMDLSRSQMR